MEGARTVLHLVRHGETSANVDGVWHGSIDTPLTDRGQEQARRVAKLLGSRLTGAAAIYTSPLQRAAHTAAAIGRVLDLEPQIERNLSEYHLGSWEGKTYAELNKTHRFFQRIQEDPDFAPDGAESVRQVTERFSGALLRIAQAHPGEDVVVVAHGGALTLGLGWLLDETLSTWRRVMDNCAVSQLALTPKTVLLEFNQTAHLDGIE